MFSFFRKKTPSEAATAAPERSSWLSKLQAGLRKTGRNFTTVFTGTRIDDALYEALEEALLMADTGVAARARQRMDPAMTSQAFKAAGSSPST